MKKLSPFWRKKNKSFANLAKEISNPTLALTFRRLPFFPFGLFGLYFFGLEGRKQTTSVKNAGTMTKNGVGLPALKRGSRTLTGFKGKLTAFQCNGTVFLCKPCRLRSQCLQSLIAMLAAFVRNRTDFEPNASRFESNSTQEGANASRFQSNAERIGCKACRLCCQCFTL